MSRIANAIMNGTYNTDLNKPQLDIRYGGQQGWAPKVDEWINNQAYVSRPLTCIVLEVPKMFTAMTEPEKWIAAYKAMFELHSRTIEGLAQGLSVDWDEHTIGGDGNVQQEFVNVTRARSSPRHGIVEKYGRPFQSLLDIWIRYGMMDPETKFALLNHKVNGKANDLLADWYTGTNLYFEPCPLNKTVDKAWIITNMMPNGTGDITAKRDLTSGQEILNLDIEFSAIQQVGLGVNALAQKILDGLNANMLDPYTRPAWTTTDKQYGAEGRSAASKREDGGYSTSIKP